jgi:glycerol-3-phosphate dehydrogenase subunit B
MIERAFDEFSDLLQQAGLPYVGRRGENLKILTSVGTVKRTYRVPASMGQADYGLRHGSPGLLVDFEGFKGYSARQIAETVRPQWPGLRTVRLPFPEGKGSLFAEHMAMALEEDRVLRILADAVRPHLGNAQVVGFPAVLGIYKPHKVYTDMERALGVRVFEIPIMPPAVAGLRLKSALEEQFTKGGGRLFSQHVVRRACSEEGRFILEIGWDSTEAVVHAGGAVLATGRLFGKGLKAERGAIVETVFGLPVHQPGSRSEWHNKEMFSLEGHAVNTAGLETDGNYRPLDNSGLPAFGTLYAAGSILGHQDWMRQKCGAGLAIVTAYAAVHHFFHSSAGQGRDRGR